MTSVHGTVLLENLIGRSVLDARTRRYDPQTEGCDTNSSKLLNDAISEIEAVNHDALSSVDADAFNCHGPTQDGASAPGVTWRRGGGGGGGGGVGGGGGGPLYRDRFDQECPDRVS